MNTNFAKLCAIAIFGGVVKALFEQRPPVTHNHYPVIETEKSDTEVEA